jgi:hypothetical protein
MAQLTHFQSAGFWFLSEEILPRKTSSSPGFCNSGYEFPFQDVERWQVVTDENLFMEVIGMRFLPLAILLLMMLPIVSHTASL